MEKISGIVPASHRVTSVNLKDSQTMRPGAPSFGAPVGKAAINGGNSLTTAEKAVAAHKTLMDRRSGDAHKPEIIENMTDKFFMKNQSGPGGVVDDIDINFNMDRSVSAPAIVAPSVSVPASDMQAQEYEVNGSNGEAAEWLIAESAVDGEADYMPPGSYLDVSV